MPDPRIAQVHQMHQSLWLDNLSRRLVRSGDLARLRDLGVTGITSNPTIFQKAVAEGTDYEAAIRRLIKAGHGPQEMLWDLMIEDVRDAADVFLPVFDRTGGRDGFVSIEVSPEVAHSAEQTVLMARDLRRRCDRPNVMVKIPATSEGVPAIRKRAGRDTRAREVETRLLDLRRAHPHVALDRPAIHDGVGKGLERHRSSRSRSGVGRHARAY